MVRISASLSEIKGDVDEVFSVQAHSAKTYFPADMTLSEAKLMHEHSVYWRHLMKKGVMVFGPVSYPQGTYDVTVVQLEDDADANALGMNEPTSMRMGR
jgi:hypothetical protein